MLCCARWDNFLCNEKDLNHALRQFLKSMLQHWQYVCRVIAGYIYCWQILTFPVVRVRGNASWIEFQWRSTFVRDILNRTQPYMQNIPFANDVLWLIVYWIKLRILYMWSHRCVEPRICEVLCVLGCVWFSVLVCMWVCFRVRVWMWNVMYMNVCVWFCSYGFVQ
jgi:hypothetical protein